MLGGADYLRHLGDEADKLEGHLRRLRRGVAAPAVAGRAERERLARAVDAVLPCLTEVAEALRALGRRQDSAWADTGDGVVRVARRQVLAPEEEAEEANRRGY